jgi:hypothetical protein
VKHAAGMQQSAGAWWEGQIKAGAGGGGALGVKKSTGGGGGRAGAGGEC